MEIQQVQLLAGPRYGRIQPAHILPVNHFLGDVTLIYENTFPLAPLGFVAGNGIGVLHLLGFHIRVLPVLT